MNLSGRSFKKFLKVHQRDLLAQPEKFLCTESPPKDPLTLELYLKTNLFVTCDFLDAEAGIWKLKVGGSAGGHNGVKSLISTLGNLKEFNKIFIGISRPNSKSPDIVSKWV
jgi:PTH1 family peptidyl-tRNA hydrolase